MTFAAPAPGKALPRIIQGGMGVAISNWRLARAVSSLGQLGVVSGTGLDTVLVRRLQDGDPGGHVRRAASTFPLQDIARDVVSRYYRPEGRGGLPYKRLPVRLGGATPFQRGVTMLANFVEIRLAKEGHSNPVGLNLLTKVQSHTLESLYGAMLAGVDVVLMGAGIPREIPKILDQLAAGVRASLRFDVTGLAAGEPSPQLHLDPSEMGLEHFDPPRPRFYPIVASSLLANIMAKKASGSIEGFIVEGPTAGGHNAPPRGEVHFDPSGQPIYTERDVVDLQAIGSLGLPFWVAGGSGSPQGLLDAEAAGASGIQVGTIFAYCEESGMQPDLRRQVLEASQAGQLNVRTDPLASPTGFPFKVTNVEGTISERREYEDRTRVCDLGYLREVYKKAEGGLGYRCAAEPLSAYTSKGGKLEDTVGRKCLCNALMASAGQPQVQRGGELERPIVTSGDDVTRLGSLLGKEWRYSAARALDYLLGRQQSLT